MWVVLPAWGGRGLHRAPPYCPGRAHPTSALLPGMESLGGCWVDGQGMGETVMS